MGFRGALYAWESADTGDESRPVAVVSPIGEALRAALGEQEHHISADVAYGVWSYGRATADDAFMSGAGARSWSRPRASGRAAPSRARTGSSTSAA